MGSKRRQREKPRTRFDETSGTEVPIPADEVLDAVEDLMGASADETAAAIDPDTTEATPVAESVADTVTPHDFESAETPPPEMEPTEGAPSIDPLSSAVDEPPMASIEEEVRGEPLETAVFEEPPDGLPPDPPGSASPPTQTAAQGKKPSDDKPSIEQRAMAAFSIGLLVDRGLEKLLEKFLGGAFLTPQKFAEQHGGITFDIDPMALARLDLEHAQVNEFTFVQYVDANGAKGQTAFPGSTYSLAPGLKLVSANVLPATPGMAAIWQLSESGVQLGGLQKPVLKFLKENQELLRGIAATASIVFYLYKVWQQAAQNPSQITK